MKKAGSIFSVLILCSSLSGCLGGLIPDPDKEAQDIENEAAATGAACRQSGRSLEECFDRNDSVNRTGALRGWKDMDDYMRQNKLDPQVPVQKSKEEAASEDMDKEKNKDPESLGQHKEPSEEKKRASGAAHENGGTHEMESTKSKKKTEKQEVESKKTSPVSHSPVSHLQEKIKAMNDEK